MYLFYKRLSTQYEIEYEDRGFTKNNNNNQIHSF